MDPYISCRPWFNSNEARDIGIIAFNTALCIFNSIKLPLNRDSSATHRNILSAHSGKESPAPKYAQNTTMNTSCVLNVCLSVCKKERYSCSTEPMSHVKGSLAKPASRNLKKEEEWNPWQPSPHHSLGLHVNSWLTIMKDGCNRGDRNPAEYIIPVNLNLIW